MGNMALDGTGLQCMQDVLYLVVDGLDLFFNDVREALPDQESEEQSMQCEQTQDMQSKLRFYQLYLLLDFETSNVLG